MNYQQVLSVFAEFLGAVLLSIGLIKSRKQEELETTTYFGHNPHLRSKIDFERKLVISGFIVLIAGFSFQMASFINLNVYDRIAIGFIIALFGWSIVYIYYVVRKQQFQSRLNERSKKILIDQLEDTKKRINKDGIEKPVEVTNNIIKRQRLEMKYEDWKGVSEYYENKVVGNTDLENVNRCIDILIDKLK